MGVGVGVGVGLRVNIPTWSLKSAHDKVRWTRMRAQEAMNCSWGQTLMILSVTA